MKKITFFISILAAYIFFAACEKDPKLPPETQTGAHTFGCYIDGELFLPIRTFYGNMINAYYDTIGNNSWHKGLSIWCYGNNGNKLYMSFKNPTPITSSNILIDTVSYAGIENYHVSSIYFTKFDTINRIVSGRFEFELTDTINNNIIKFTDGRFDIRFTIIN
jgi:hypothetical protein